MGDFPSPARLCTQKHSGWAWLSPVCVVYSFRAQVSLQWGRSGEPGRRAQSPEEGTSCWTRSPGSTEMQKTRGGWYQLQLHILESHNWNTVLIRYSHFYTTMSSLFCLCSSSILYALYCAYLEQKLTCSTRWRCWQLYTMANNSSE